MEVAFTVAQNDPLLSEPLPRTANAGGIKSNILFPYYFLDILEPAS